MKKHAIVLSFFLGVSIVQEAAYFSINANRSNANIVSRGINNTNVSAPANTVRQLDMNAPLLVAPNNTNTVKRAS